VHCKPSVQGCSIHHWEPLLLHQLVRLLDPETRETWKVKLGSSICLTFALFEEFLVGRACALENLSLPTPISGLKEESSKRLRTRNAAHVAATPSYKGSAKCPLCGSPHYLVKCDRYQSRTPKQCRDVIKKYRQCFNCLNPHIMTNCTSVKRSQMWTKVSHIDS